MALKKDPSISKFGKRLFGLIEELDQKTLDEEDKIKSPKGLAEKLYSMGMVHVNTNLENGNSPEKNYDNAILSIEKTIVQHIKTGIIKDKKGEFLIAYSRFFGCSTDYLLGLTDIRDPDIEVRRICQLTGLWEDDVTRLIESKKKGHFDVIERWSLLMSSDLYYSIPEDWSTLLEETAIRIQKEVELEGLEWKERQLNGSERLDVQNDIQGTREEIRSHNAAFYGVLSKISRNVENLIEQEIKTVFQSYREELSKGWMEHLKKDM